MDSMRQVAQREASQRERAPRAALHEKPIIRRHEDSFEVSIDGTHFIKTPARLAKIIRIALNVQGKLDADPLSLDREYGTLTNIVEGINCHKTVLFAKGHIDFKKLTHISIAAADNGHPEIISLANNNPDKMMMFTEDVRAYAHAHQEEFPFAIHVLRQKGSEWIPAHSLIWLGTDESGNEVCFHKAGPYLDLPFEFTTLKKTLDPYEETESLFLMVPVPSSPQATPSTASML